MLPAPVPYASRCARAQMLCAVLLCSKAFIHKYEELTCAACFVLCSVSASQYNCITVGAGHVVLYRVMH
jgi:hypothetical protein